MLAQLRRAGAFPPRDAHGYRLLFQGYEQDVVATASVRTGEDGRAEWEFTPEKDGTYRVHWSSVDGRGGDIVAVTTVFVAGDDTRELGYLAGGIEILVDKDTLRSGEEAVLVLAPTKAALEDALASAQRRYGGAGWGLDAGGFIGTPDDIIKRIREKAALGVSLFVFFFHDRGRPETLELFAREVAPAFA